ncbi:MAG: hypothetical protein HQL13_01145 [Candidatus Omnitrophica bacterium]|nr:hypothetical protein [Candidatus Omnitrophota bacterium]
MAVVVMSVLMEHLAVGVLVLLVLQEQKLIVKVSVSRVLGTGIMLVAVRVVVDVVAPVVQTAVGLNVAVVAGQDLVQEQEGLVTVNLALAPVVMVNVRVFRQILIIAMDVGASARVVLVFVVSAFVIMIPLLQVVVQYAEAMDNSVAQEAYVMREGLVVVIKAYVIAQGVIVIQHLMSAEVLAKPHVNQVIRVNMGHPMSLMFVLVLLAGNGGKRLAQGEAVMGEFVALLEGEETQLMESR